MKKNITKKAVNAIVAEAEKRVAEKKAEAKAEAEKAVNAIVAEAEKAETEIVKPIETISSEMFKECCKRFTDSTTTIRIRKAGGFCIKTKKNKSLIEFWGVKDKKSENIAYVDIFTNEYVDDVKRFAFIDFKYFEKYSMKSMFRMTAKQFESFALAQ